MVKSVVKQEICGKKSVEWRFLPLIDFGLPSPPRKPSRALFFSCCSFKRGWFSWSSRLYGGRGGRASAHELPSPVFVSSNLFLSPFFFDHGACRGQKKNDATQRQSNIPSLRWAGDRQGRRCREKNKKNTRATTGNPELNERWSEVVAPGLALRAAAVFWRTVVGHIPAVSFIMVASVR